VKAVVKLVVESEPVEELKTAVCVAVVLAAVISKLKSPSAAVSV
jgi:hypothetical protein